MAPSPLKIARLFQYHREQVPGMHYILDLDIPKDELLKFYSGAARQVNAVARGGVRLAFPASILRPHVTDEGVHGTFRLTTGGEGRLKAFERIR